MIKADWFFDRERRGFDVSVREILDRNCSSRQVVGRINISGRNGEDRNLELYRFKPGKLERALIVGEIEIPKNGDFNKLLKEGKLSEKEVIKKLKNYWK